jgi:hypothetical protein
MSVEKIVVPGITVDELLTAIKNAGFTGDESDEGKTIGELAAAWRCSEQSAVRLVRQAKDRNILKTGKRLSERIDGGRCRVPVYSFTIEKAKASTKRRTAKA